MKTISICFSPTRSTKRYLETVTRSLSGEIETIDITLPAQRDHVIEIKDELIVLGFPVYGMRIPKPALDYFSSLRGNGNPFAAVVVYGNIDIGIVFKQIEKIASDQHLNLVGVGCFVAQHAYSTDLFPVAAGRPSNEDLVIAKSFGENLNLKIYEGDFSAPVLENTLIPTAILKAPYNGTRRLLVQPKVNFTLCNHCDRCIKQCPAGAIENDLQIIESQCLRCLSCVKNCPSHARESHFRARWMGKGLAWMGKKAHTNHFFV